MLVGNIIRVGFKGTIEKKLHMPNLTRSGSSTQRNAKSFLSFSYSCIQPIQHAILIKISVKK